MNTSGPPIVFDQYQRYRFIERVVRLLLSQEKKPRILEVGGAFSPLRQLLPNYPLVIVDKAFETAIDLQADGLQLPFSNETFDLVVSTDALEHLKPSDRPRFLSELQRVTLQTLIIGFPQKSALAESADLTLKEYIRAVTGTDFEYLKEHLEYGLPDPEKIREALSGAMPEILEFENASLDSWLFLQIANFLTHQRPEFESVSRLLNQFFNQYYEPESHSTPCYRTFLVASKCKTPAPLLVEMIEQTGWEPKSPVVRYSEKSALLASAFTEVLDARNLELKRAEDILAAADITRQQLEMKIAELKEKLEASIEQLDANKKELQRKDDQIQKKSAALISYSQKNRNLQDYLNLFLNHPVYKGYKLFKQFTGKTATHREAGDYERFQLRFEPTPEQLRKQREESRKWKMRPLFSIITPLYSPGIEIFEKTMESVRSQSYENWIWEVVDASADNEAWQVLQSIQKDDPRIHAVRLSENLGIAENTNVALKRATGDYIVMLDHDDMLAPHALFAVAELIRKHADADFIYSDCDKLDEQGHRCEPFFKPDWSPHSMLSFNLLNQLSVYRRSWLDRIGYLDPAMDGAQDWDLYFRIADSTKNIYHIPQILYHWRQTPGSTALSFENKPYARKAQIAAVTAHLKRCGIDSPVVKFEMNHPVWSSHPVVQWNSRKACIVSIIIPSRDQAAILERCLETLFEHTDANAFEVIVVDTGSKEPETRQLYEKYQRQNRFRVVHQSPPFNFGKACNFGASHASGDLLLFLNNDTEILHDGWLELLTQWFELEDIGIVGAKLLYPGGRLQHAGVIVGIGGIASHIFIKEQENIGTMFGTDGWYRDVSAVTGACLMISRRVFDEVKGFDEDFVLLYSDVDLCLKAGQAGYNIVYTPQVRLIHHESLTHRGRAPRSDFERATQKWKKWLQQGDPFFNPNLSYASSMPVFHQSAADTAEYLNRALMSRMPKKEIIVMPDDVN
jgi:GT2 family glycosyltransferase